MTPQWVEELYIDDVTVGEYLVKQMKKKERIAKRGGDGWWVKGEQLTKRKEIEFF